ncbi:replicative DNA helicase [Nocardia wallacei]|uniref:replicative DNA helicase n=1 Tax=Nocardia wallacei TaxID=480035 RepID=UPI002455FFB9|nr:DnaB-like helicase C-terminal domain-containing protein [Nocardia wallacei]
MTHTDNTEEIRYDEHTERALLGAVMAAPDRTRNTFQSIWADAWYSHQAATLAAVITDMLKNGQHIDPNTVLVQAQNQGLATKLGGGAYIFTCYQEAGTAEAAPLLAQRIRNLATCRDLHNIADRVMQRVQTSWTTGADPADTTEHITYLKRELEAIETRNTDPDHEQTVKKFADAVKDFWEWQDAETDADAIMTPWPELDDLLAGGLHRGRSYLFAGRPGGGKSLALSNIAGYAAELDYKGLLFSVEMGTREVTARILAAGARAEYGQITRRFLDERNHTLIREYITKVADMPLWISDQANLTVDKIRAEALKLKRTIGLDFVCVDYIQLLRATDTRVPRERQIAEISRALKVLAKDLDVAVVSACQLNRGATKEKRPPTIAELRESGSLEQDSDVVILLHNTETEKGEPTGEVEMIVGKNRTGKLSTITLEFRGYQARLGNR